MSQTVMIDDVVDPAAEQVDLDVIATAAAGGDVHLGWFSDEEVHLLSPDPTRPPHRHIDAPRLATLPDEQRSAALEATRWTLQARGYGYHTPDGRFEVVREHALLAALRWSAATAISVRVDQRDVGTLELACYRIHPRLWLSEEVHPMGLHEFTFRSPTAQTAWLATNLDADDVADATGEPVHARSLDQLDPSPERLAADAQRASLLYAAERDAGPERADRSVTVYAGGLGVHALSGWTDPDGDTGHVQLRRLGATDLAALCDAFLHAPIEALGRTGGASTT